MLSASAYSHWPRLNAVRSDVVHNRVEVCAQDVGRFSGARRKEKFRLGKALMLGSQTSPVCCFIGMRYELKFKMHLDIQKKHRTVVYHELLFCFTQFGNRPVLLATAVHTGPPDIVSFDSGSPPSFQPHLHRWIQLRFMKSKLLRISTMD